MPENEIHNPHSSETNASPLPENFAEEFKNERDLFMEGFSARLDNAGRAMSRYLTTKELAQWNRLMGISSEIYGIEIKEKPTHNSYDISESCILDIFSAAKSLLHYQNIEERKKLAKQHNLLDSYEPLAQYQHFDDSGIVLCKIDELSIMDMVSNKKLPAGALFSSFIDSLSEDTSTSETKPAYQDPLTNLYPKTAENIYMKAELATISVFLMSRMNPQFFERRDLIQGNQKIAREIIDKTKQITGGARHHIENTHNTLLDPRSSDFIALKKQVEMWLLKNDASASIPVMHRVGFIKNIFYDYRMAKKLAQADINNSSDFYKLLSQSLLEYAQSRLTEEGYLTSDDIPTILDTDQIVPGDTPSIDDLKKTANAIFLKSRKSEYTINPEEINWKNLVPPAKVDVEFPMGNGRLINLILFYKNDKGESLQLKVYFDTKKNIMDWIFMDESDDPSMLDIKNAVMYASYEILNNAAQQTEAEYQQKHRTKQVLTTPQSPRPKTEYVPREKEERKEQSRHLSAIEQILITRIAGTPTPETPRVKNQITLPDENQLEDLMNRISIPDRHIIITGLQRYNDEAVGEFIMLKGENDEGEKIYRLRINAGPRGGTRVLMQETKSEDTPQNTRQFKITDIGYRKNIYRKL